VLVAERVREIDEAAELSSAQQWQRAQAWETWEKLRDGDVEEASAEHVASDFDSALARAKTRKG